MIAYECLYTYVIMCGIRIRFTEENKTQHMLLMIVYRELLLLLLIMREAEQAFMYNVTEGVFMFHVQHCREKNFIFSYIVHYIYFNIIIVIIYFCLGRYNMSYNFTDCSFFNAISI